MAKIFDRCIAMVFKDWDIWFTYSSFLDDKDIDLFKLGERLVKSKLAYCAMHRDGRTWWAAEGETLSGITSVDINSRRTGAEITLSVDNDKESKLTGFAKEAWYQASCFRFSEKKLCMDGPLPPPYIRAYLGEFRLINDKENAHVIIYPVVKIFESGVVVVEFRVFSPQRDLGIKEFINNYVNMAFLDFDVVMVPTEISYYASVSSCLLRKL